MPLPSKVAAISGFPQPVHVRQLEEFIGMVNFYNRFIPNIASILRPLYAALSGSPKPKTVEWSQVRISSFNAAKSALSSATMLTHPVPGAPLSLVTDASDSGVGAVLQQRVNGKDSPLAFFSHQLSTAESKYSAYDRELLAIYLAVRHFRYFVEGRTFVIYTDHKPLSFAMAKVSDQWSSRQQRQLKLRDRLGY